MARALMAAFLFLAVGCADDSAIEPTGGDDQAAEISGAPDEATPELVDCGRFGDVCTTQSGCAQLHGRFKGTPCGPIGFGCCETD